MITVHMNGVPTQLPDGCTVAHALGVMLEGEDATGWDLVDLTARPLRTMDRGAVLEDGDRCAVLRPADYSDVVVAYREDVARGADAAFDRVASHGYGHARRRPGAP